VITIVLSVLNHLASQWNLDVIQGVYNSSITNFQDIYFFLNSTRFFRDKPHNIKMQAKFVMSENLILFLSLTDIYWTGMLTPDIIVILFT